MSYLAFDLDALKLVPDAARSAGIDEAALGYGLVRLWSFCWTAKRETVVPAHLVGFFGGETDRVICALIAFEFLEPLEGAYRVRGADKYLRITKARSDAGKAKSGNLRRGSEAKQEPGPSRDPAGTQPGQTRESAPALTASSEQRAARVVSFGDDGAPPSAGFFAWAQDQRVTALGVVREKPPHPTGFGAWLSRAMAEVGGDVARLQAGWLAYLRDPHWVARGCPWAGWISQWERHVPAAAPVPASKPACSCCGAESDVEVWGLQVCRACHGLWAADSRFAGALPPSELRERTQAWVAERRVA